jgi:hypothetical protein
VLRSLLGVGVGAVRVAETLVSRSGCKVGGLETGELLRTATPDAAFALDDEILGRLFACPASTMNGSVAEDAGAGTLALCAAEYEAETVDCTAEGSP